MTSASQSRRAVLVVLAAGSLALGACSSSGGGGTKPSQSKVEAQLKKDSTLKPLLTRVSATKRDSVVSCVAKAMEKGVKTSDLNDFVKGKKKLGDLRGSGKDAQAASQEAANCVTSAA